MNKDLNKPTFSDENIKSLYDARFLRLYDLQYKEGAHYYDVSRRESSSLVARKSDEEFKTMLPDAVTIAVIVKIADDEPKLLLNYEYRYPVGQYLLSPIAGPIDPADRSKDDPLIEAAKREVFEESGLKVKDSDSIEVINPCAFSSPGMTDESNAFLCARISIDDVSEFSQDGAEGSELFNGYELVGRKEAAEIFRSGRDKYGNFFSIATWVVLAHFLLED